MPMGMAARTQEAIVYAAQQRFGAIARVETDQLMILASMRSSFWNSANRMHQTNICLCKSSGRIGNESPRRTSSR